jgi:hypothetical protein
VVKFTQRPICHRESSTRAHSIGRWLGPRLVLDALKTEKFIVPLESQTTVLQASIPKPIRYTDCTVCIELVIVLISDWVNNSVKLTSEWSREAVGQRMNGRVTYLKSATENGGRGVLGRGE